jgi:hypothetical protein
MTGLSSYVPSVPFFYYAVASVMQGSRRILAMPAVCFLGLRVFFCHAMLDRGSGPS